MDKAKHFLQTEFMYISYASAAWSCLSSTLKQISAGQVSSKMYQLLSFQSFFHQNKFRNMSKMLTFCLLQLIAD